MMTASESQQPVVVFAYGSNMPKSRIQARCPSARALGVAELRGHELRWHKRSIDGSGKCDIVSVADNTASVFGVLYEIAASEKSKLDRAEGLGAGYKEVDITVVHSGQPRTVKAYVATDIAPVLQPYVWYRDLVLAGAAEHALPAAYIEHLKAVIAIDDPDRERHASNMKLIAGARP
jgi:cation transport regulator ChaC